MSRSVSMMPFALLLGPSSSSVESDRKRVTTAICWFAPLLLLLLTLLSRGDVEEGVTEEEEGRSAAVSACIQRAVQQKARGAAQGGSGVRRGLSMMNERFKKAVGMCVWRSDARAGMGLGLGAGQRSDAPRPPVHPIMSNHHTSITTVVVHT